MGRHILSGTRMDVTQDARVVSLSKGNEAVHEQEQKFEGRSTNTQLQQQIAVSEPGQSTNVEESLELKDERAETDGAAGLEEKQILIAETNEAIKCEETVTARETSLVTSQELFRPGTDAAAQRGLSLQTGSTSLRFDDAQAAPTGGDLEVDTRAREEQVGVSANNKRPAVSMPGTGSPLWWDANRLADPRETKRSGELMHRNRQVGVYHASTGPNISRWESINCETRAQEPYSAQCPMIDVRVEGNSENLTSSMQGDPVPISRSRETSPEPTVISLEERQEQLRLQSIEMRLRSHRARPAPVPRPVNESSATCSQPDLLSWRRLVERRNEERRNVPDRDFTERYNFDIHRDLPLKEGRWEWENVQQP